MNVSSESVTKLIGLVQLTFQEMEATQRKKSPLKQGGEPMHHPNSQSNSHYNSHSHSHAQLPPRAHPLIDFKWEKSGLNDEYDLYDVISSPVFDTIGVSPHISAPALNLYPTSLGLTGFGDLQYYLIDVSSVPATVANQNEIKIRFDSVRGCT